MILRALTGFHGILRHLLALAAQRPLCERYMFLITERLTQILVKQITINCPIRQNLPPIRYLSLWCQLIGLDERLANISVAK